jgi:hypothetical protein
MPTLSECMKSIRELVKEKGHEDKLENVEQKLFFAVLEIAEAGDLLKKHGFVKAHEMSEELIDAIFYILDAYGIMHRDLPTVINPDTMFTNKLKKNLKREYHYGRPEKGIVSAASVGQVRKEIEKERDDHASTG